MQKKYSVIKCIRNGGIIYRKYVKYTVVSDKSIDGVLGSRTRGRMFEGADESTELWRHPKSRTYLVVNLMLHFIISSSFLNYLPSCLHIFFGFPCRDLIHWTRCNHPWECSGPRTWTTTATTTTTLLCKTHSLVDCFDVRTRCCQTK